jgi:NADH:ubiquinone oxidoreductase subunit 6 (subunit J)
MLHIGLTVGVLIFVLQAIRAMHLLIAAMWLACSSALLSALLYSLGAREIAVIELSVGAGLVTVLFAFSLSLVGESVHDVITVVPRLLILALVLHAVILLVWLVMPLEKFTQPLSLLLEPSFSNTLWQARSLDVLLQIALIFVGALTVLSLLAETALSARTEIRHRTELPESAREIKEKIG